MSKKIVTVDDSASVRQMVAFTLKGNGYEVIECEDGPDALNKINGAGAHLVITDLNMPNMNGLDLIKALRAKSEYQFLPIVFLSTEVQSDKKKPPKLRVQPVGYSNHSNPISCWR